MCIFIARGLIQNFLTRDNGKKTMQQTQNYSDKSTLAISRSFWRTPSMTIARLTLESYFRSGWMWVEFVLVLVFFAALFFPFQEDVPYFYGTSNWDLSAIAVLGAAIMVRQATSARTYALLARLSSRASYSRGLMLASAVLRIPIFLFMFLLELARNLVGVRGDEALDTEQADRPQGHPPAEAVSGQFHGIGHDVKE